MYRHTEAEATALILRAYWRYYDKHGYPPTLRELAKASGYSLAALYYWLGKMEASGVVERVPRTARGLRVVLD